MKRLGSSDSLGALIPICPSTEEHSPRTNLMYSREYQSMLDGLDEEGCVEESAHVPEKKRRLSVDQVKALEKNFEVENKLEPERKVKLAQELGLQPRQVAVWFQNRRARWKTKQLERDYGVLKASYDSLKQNYDSFKLDKEALLKEIKELKSKLNEDNTESDMSVKEEQLMSESDINNDKGIEPITLPASLDGGGSDDEKVMKGKNDGPSESDSSAIFNEDNSSSSPNASNSQQMLLMSSNSSVFRFNCSSSPPPSTNCFSVSDSRSEDFGSTQNYSSMYHSEFVKVEEYNFFSAEESCNFFSDEAAPTLHWYSHDQWT